MLLLLLCVSFSGLTHDDNPETVSSRRARKAETDASIGVVDRDIRVDLNSSSCIEALSVHTTVGS